MNRAGKFPEAFESKGILPPADIRQATAWAATEFETRFAGAAPVDAYSLKQCYATPAVAP